MVTRWATRVVEQEVVFLSPAIDEHLDDDKPFIEAPSPERETTGLLERVVFAVGTFFREISLWGLELPVDPAFRQAKSLSDRERVWLEAYWKYDIHI